MTDYRIKPGYRSNARPAIYRDTVADASRYQLDVYRRAAELARSPEVRSVLDIGCGLGTKLVEHVAPQVETVTGIDAPETIEACKRRYTVGRWLAGDLEDPAFSIDEKFDLIISADVVEHLRDPDQLLRRIRAASHEATDVILSTPERDRRRGTDDMGPPANPAHVREWNAREFGAYLESRGFAIRESRIVDLCEGMPTCQMVVGRFERGPR